MTPKQKIEELKREIASLEKTMQYCKHVFKDAIYDPETIREEYATGGYEGHGADRWPVTAFRDKIKQRWSRECSICGKKEYTYEQEPVIKNYQPKFK